MKRDEQLFSNLEKFQSNGWKKPPDRSNEVIDVDDITYVDDKDKAKELTKTYKDLPSYQCEERGS